MTGITDTITPTKSQLQKISEGARDIMRCKVLMTNVLSTTLVQKKMAHNALKESTSTVLVAVVGTIQMIFKSTAHYIVHTCYGLHPDILDPQADPEVQQKKDLIPQLLTDNIFLHKLCMVC
ncbi:hypothetical protein PAXRUDRAFT_140084 [Paxillus rubicundulus Ve08.2h10]|uniref:Uncharacterized protein n=1 Tax=Paxillus rubicundulus Ve08.2h10 TaxID=930991 RepID=A0A0D0E9D4_9AGAM|nr:hypothetical protein PAXRUDRAFT_140084 [Paxillus rubicundulus Ve08.2h10]